MQWLLLIMIAYVLLGLEQGLAVVMSQPGMFHAVPGLLLILAVYIGLSAPTAMVLWSSVLLGVFYDLAHPLLIANSQSMTDAAIIGPGALGFLAGGVLLLQMRSMVYRVSSVSIAIFTLVTGVAVHLTIVLIFAVRGMSFAFLPGDIMTGWNWSDDLVSRFFSLLGSCILAIPIGWCLLRIGGGFGFEAAKGSKHGGKRY